MSLPIARRALDQAGAITTLGSASLRAISFWVSGGLLSPFALRSQTNIGREGRK